jgi:hypothetical protein
VTARRCPRRPSMKQRTDSVSLDAMWDAGEKWRRSVASKETNMKTILTMMALLLLCLSALTIANAGTARSYRFICEGW